MEPSRMIKTFKTISIALFLFSLTQKTYCVDGDCGENWSGLMCFLLGFFSILYGASGFSWFANPLLIISYYIPLQNINAKFYCSLAAVVLTLYFLLFDEIIKNESGQYGQITGYALGYWSWVSSAVMNLMGISIIKYDLYGRNGGN